MNDWERTPSTWKQNAHKRTQWVIDSIVTLLLWLGGAAWAWTLIADYLI